MSFRIIVLSAKNHNVDYETPRDPYWYKNTSQIAVILFISLKVDNKKYVENFI